MITSSGASSFLIQLPPWLSNKLRPLSLDLTLHKINDMSLNYASSITGMLDLSRKTSEMRFGDAYVQRMH